MHATREPLSVSIDPAPTQPLLMKPAVPVLKRPVNPGNVHSATSLLCHFHLHLWSQGQLGRLLPRNEVRFCRWCARVKVDGVIYGDEEQKALSAELEKVPCDPGPESQAFSWRKSLL